MLSSWDRQHEHCTQLASLLLNIPLTLHLKTTVRAFVNYNNLQLTRTSVTTYNIIYFSLKIVISYTYTRLPISVSIKYICRLCKLRKGCTRPAAASNKVHQLLVHGRWFSPGTPASSTTKTSRHDIAEILLKVALSTINQIKSNIFALTLGCHILLMSDLTQIKPCNQF